MRELFVVTPPGLEEAARREASALGLAGARAVPGGVEGRGELPLALRLDLASRIASRVLVRLGACALPELPRLARSIGWRELFAPGAAFRIESSGGGARPRELERPLAEAIARAVPGAAPGGAGAQAILVRLAAGRVTVSADASGDHLHLRGWRLETGPAPLRENLAAGILALAGYTGEETLLDPMCGSGTFAVEAALIALRRAPGLGRGFSCEGWPALPAATAAAEREALRAAERAAPPRPILASDRNAGSLGVARRNAARAGVLGHLRLERKDATDLRPPEPSGVLVANPPYGRRVGERRELGELHRRFGRVLRERFTGWRVAVLVGEARFADELALPGAERLPLRNGGIPCLLVRARL